MVMRIHMLLILVSLIIGSGANAQDNGFVVEHESTFGESLAPEPDLGYKPFYNGVRHYVRSHYPRAAFVFDVGGTVVLNFNIDEHGYPTDFEVTYGLGADCEEVAIEAVKAQGHWHSGMKGGVFTKMPVQVNVDFSTNDCKYKKLHRYEAKLRRKYFKALRKFKREGDQCQQEHNILVKYVQKYEHSRAKHLEHKGS